MTSHVISKKRHSGMFEPAARFPTVLQAITDCLNDNLSKRSVADRNSGHLLTPSVHSTFK